MTWVNTSLIKQFTLLDILSAISNQKWTMPCELKDLDVIIPHQTNLRITDGLIAKLGVPKEKDSRIIHSIGNTSGASVAMSSDLAALGKADDVKLNPGDIIGLTATAGGHSAGSIIFRY